MTAAKAGLCIGTDLQLWFGPADGTPHSLRETPAEQAFREHTAKGICASCPLVSACLQEELAHGIGNQWGVRGGMTAKERKELIRARRAEVQVA
jgi:WhiB family redox-sensing transcriptional regulator